EGHDDVAEEDGRVDAVPAHRLEGDLGDEVGGPARLQHRHTLPDLPVLRQRAAGLAHEPHRGERHRLLPGRPHQGAVGGRAGRRVGGRRSGCRGGHGAILARPGGAPLPGVSEDTLRLGSVVSRIQGGRGGVAGPGIPDAFARAVDGVRSAVLRPEVVVEEVPAPTRLAPSALALSGEVYPTRSLDEEPTATGRFVLLHGPSAPEPWEGVWRVVTYAKAAMEPELGHDPMLGQVGWSWLTEALESHGLAFAAEAGAVTCVL